MEHLKELRNNKKLTLAEAAKEIGTDASNMSRIERGIQNLSLEMAKKLSGLYGVSIDFIVTGIDEKDKATAA